MRRDAPLVGLWSTSFPVNDPCFLAVSVLILVYMIGHVSQFHDYFIPHLFLSDFPAEHMLQCDVTLGNYKGLTSGLHLDIIKEI